ncbi:hypothetical protein PROFUN_13711 [Planoprotostelium fungivorum]|uniref:Rolly protein n=1 Tax=Planoprotostelium fungivorum TaxID=1890364 RepID=A0A2P6N380_9EUKA|nr:rolly protein [Planoprotostelium fungivorum]PRP78407.1 hypothetical protein PROFUN_13711 [Planoprotostelium fungivorum]
MKKSRAPSTSKESEKKDQDVSPQKKSLVISNDQREQLLQRCQAAHTQLTDIKIRLERKRKIADEVETLHKRHLQMLHDYNDAKDAGQMLLGRLAVMEGLTTKDMYQQYGLELED